MADKSDPRNWPFGHLVNSSVNRLKRYALLAVSKSAPRAQIPEKMVPATGLEPVQCYLLEPESSASANSATRALRDLRENTVADDKRRASFQFGLSGSERNQTVKARRAYLLADGSQIVNPTRSGEP